MKSRFLPFGFAQGRNDNAKGSVGDVAGYVSRNYFTRS